MSQINMIAPVIPTEKHELNVDEPLIRVTGLKRLQLIQVDEICLRLESNIDHQPGCPTTSREHPIDAVLDSTTNEGDDYTSQNWKSFIAWKIGKENEAARESDPVSFEDGIPESSKPLTVTKTISGDDASPTVELAISSTFLQAQLTKFARIEQYPGTSLRSTEIVLYNDFPALYHHIEEMATNVAQDTTASTRDRHEMKTLYSFITKGFKSKMYQDIKEELSRGLIRFDHIWAVFKVGDLVFTKTPLGLSEIGVIRSISTAKDDNNSKIFHWIVNIAKINWRLGFYKKVSVAMELYSFRGSKKITDLDFYPLSYRQDQYDLKESGMKRGELWKKYLERGVTTMSYQGLALPLVEKTMFDIDDAPDTGRSRSYRPMTLSATVIVDPTSINKIIQQVRVDINRLAKLPEFQFNNKFENLDVENFSDGEYLICPSSLAVFSIDDHEWYSVDVTGLKGKEWKLEAFDRLVLNPAQKAVLVSLAKTNSNFAESNKLGDIIEGKGGGTVLLFHGPPGVGKTLTAEVLAEYAHRPLFKVNLGRVANHNRWEQALERIFANAEDWKAILLIDEAEIVLEKRTFERMTHNSWISTFLRKLEYYKGIIILTTNLLDSIDEAFESRISYPIKFPELCREDREKIWRDFINDIKMLPAYRNVLLDNVPRWSEAEINGRQIRNIILTAQNIAVGDDTRQRITPDHIDNLLNVILDFCLYNQHNSSRAKKIQFTGPSY